MRISISDMTCSHCQSTIESAVLDADEGAELDFDLQEREVYVTSVLPAQTVIQVIAAAGYDAKALS